MTSSLALITLAAASFMAGALWVIQVVHYPLLGEVADDSITRVATKHQGLITWVVGPVMVIEASSSLLLLFRWPTEVIVPSLIAFGLLATAVSVTVFQAVPLHSKIAAGQVDLIPKLVRINWTRTVAWTLRIPFGTIVAYQVLN